MTAPAVKHTATVDPRPSDYRESQCAAYLDSMTMAKAMAHVGDVLRLTTKRGRMALVRIVGVQPSGSAGTVRFDRFTRQTLKAFPHEELTIEKVELAPARQVTLIPAIDLSMLR